MKISLILSFCLALLSSYAYVQTYTIGSPTHTSSTPALNAINTLYLRMCGFNIYIRLTELTNAGIVADFQIDAIHLLINDLPGVTMSNFTISVKEYLYQFFNATPIYDGGLTTVYSSASMLPSEFLIDNWKQFVFESHSLGMARVIY